MDRIAGYSDALRALRKRANKNNRVMDSILGVKRATKQRRKSNGRAGPESGSEGLAASPSGLPLG